MITLPWKRTKPSYNLTTVTGTREFLKKEIGFEIKRNQVPMDILRYTPEWSPFFIRQYEILNSKLEKRKYRSRIYIKELERCIEKQRNRRAKNYLRKFNELVSTAGNEIAENNFKIEIEKWEKINQMNSKKKAMDILLKAAGSFLTGEVTYIHLGHLPSLSVGVLSVFAIDEVQKKLGSYQLKKLEEKREETAEKIIKGTTIDIASVFKECFPYAVKGVEETIEFLVNIEEPIEATCHF
jgi:hypothetical protein